MDKATFSVLANIIVKSHIEEEYQRVISYDDKDKFKISCAYSNNENAFNRYIEKLFDRYQVRNRELKKQLEMDPTKDKLDCHKVAAVLLYSILDLKPIKFSLKSINKVSDIDDMIKLVNYRIAFKSACGVIFVDMVKELNDEAKNGITQSQNALNLLLEKGRLFMPKVRKELPAYLDNYAKILYFNDRVKGDCADYLEIADTMFLIEIINKSYLKGIEIVE